MMAAATTQSDTATSPYERLGGENGVRELVDRFYDLMDSLAEVKHLRDMHAKSLRGSRRKLFMFLSGWLDGPQLYIERYGHPHLRQRHFPFSIGPRERDQWMLCMNRALDDMQMPGDLREGLRSAFAQMAEHLRNDQQRGCPSQSLSNLKAATPKIGEAHHRNDSAFEVDRFHARALLAQGAQAMDLRDAEDYADGHLPDAKHLPLSDDTPLQDIDLEHDRPVLLYCTDGTRSSALCAELRELGLAHCFSLGGGFRYWRTAGEPVESDLPTSDTESSKETNT